MLDLKKLKELRHKANIEVTGSSNYPFYIAVNKPRPSLSKHDETRASYWHCDDATFMIEWVRAADDILEALEKLDDANR